MSTTPDIIKLVRQLGDALEAAASHLSYCGYGDSWERECAKAENLEPKIQAALSELTAFEQSLSSVKPK